MQRNTGKRCDSRSPKRCSQDKPHQWTQSDKPAYGEESKWRLNSCLALLIFVSCVVSAQYIQICSIRSDLSLDTLVSVAGPSPTDQSTDALTPKAWIVGTRMEVGYLQHVIDIFKRVGFKIVNGSAGEDWDILWSHDYPFGHLLTHALKPHQRVNHFPGCGFITNKVSLATSEIIHIPKAFHIPKQVSQFLDYANHNPQVEWVQKSNAHRGIQVQKLDHIDLNGTGTFVQEFISNPLLIDGRKFDIGLYVTVTSLNPLRVYIYDGEALLRFCSQNYHPFNSSNLNSYVVGDDYTPIWEMPSLKKYYNDAKFNMKQSLNSYLESIGKQPSQMWKQIEESICSVFIAKERQMYGLMSSMHMDARHFFEMVRFDFLVDEQLNVHLLEANMSPNLSSLHFRPNQALYEHVILNVMSLNRLLVPEAIGRWSELEDTFFAHRIASHEMSVRADLCASDRCLLSCQAPECHLCTFCLTPETKLQLKDAILEHHNRLSHRRLLPNVRNSSLNSHFGSNLLHLQWYQGKCLQDASWC